MQSTVTLAGHEYPVARARLKLYLELQVAKQKIHKAAAAYDGGGIADSFFDYLQTCIPDLSRPTFNSVSWLEIFSCFATIENINQIPKRTQFSILNVYAESKEDKGEPWDYSDRFLFLWPHIIARSYHWSLGDIHELWPEQAVAFVQEILASDYYEMSFQHRMAETSYSHSKDGKVTYNELPKPGWMTEQRKGRRGYTPPHLKPVGLIIKAHNDEETNEGETNAD
jgi:hypothetical protein